MRRLSPVRNPRDWWLQRVAATETPFFAEAVTDLKPDAVEKAMPGVKIFSAVFQPGIRTHCFTNQADRDRFLTRFRKVWSARAVGDPCK